MPPVKNKKWNVQAWDECKEIVRSRRMSAVGASREIKLHRRRILKNSLTIGELLEENRRLNEKIVLLTAEWERAEREIEEAYKSYEKSDGWKS